MTVKTDVSRFHIHDELTAPDGSAPLLKSIQTAGGTVSKFIGILAESSRSSAPIRGCATSFVRAVSARHARERIGLAVAEWRNDPYTLTQYSRTARAAGLGLDEVARARNFTSSDEKEAALLALLRETLDPRAPTPSPGRGGEGGRLERRGDPRGGRRAGPGRVREPVRLGCRAPAGGRPRRPCGLPPRRRGLGGHAGPPTAAR